MSVRGVLQAISALAALAAGIAFLTWSSGPSRDIDFAASTARVKLLSTIINGGIALSFVAGIASTVVKDSMGRRSLVGLTIVLAAAIMATAIFWIMTHLGIS
jgi:hypothetical protein